MNRRSLVSSMIEGRVRLRKRPHRVAMGEGGGNCRHTTKRHRSEFVPNQRQQIRRFCGARPARRQITFDSFIATPMLPEILSLPNM